MTEFQRVGEPETPHVDALIGLEELTLMEYATEDAWLSSDIGVNLEDAR